jgi:hypothetical protein
MNQAPSTIRAPASQASIPDFLIHYYQVLPFRTLSDLSPADATLEIAELAKERALPFRLRQAEYLPRRRAIESEMRRAFLAKGGQPKRENPHYLVLGQSRHWEKMVANSVCIPLAEIGADVVSFTFTDSFYTYSERTLHGRVIPPAPHRRIVFTLHELEDAIHQFGMPRGYSDPSEEFDVYIEAQLWTDGPLRELLESER